MKLLPKDFKKNNFHHKQIHREGNLAVYERYWTPSEEPHKHYEVIKIQHKKERTFPNGTTYPECEAYPSDAHWGTYGFTCLTKDQAYNRLERLKEENTTPNPKPQYPKFLQHIQNLATFTPK